MRASNPVLRRNVVLLQRKANEEKAAIWDAASAMLGRTSSGRVAVNVGHIAKVAKEGSPVFVPGKVLGSGVAGKKLVVGAYSYSSVARKKIAGAGGEALGVEEFLKRYPKGSGVILVE